MTRFIVSIGLLLMVAFAALGALAGMVGGVLPYEGEIRYFVTDVETYTPYHLDVRHGVVLRGSEIPYSLVWSPDNQHIYFQAYYGLYLSDESALYMSDALGRFPFALTNEYVYPIWSRDYTRIALSSLDSLSSIIYLANGDGTEVTSFAPYGEGDYRQPQFSPDSTQLAYILNDDLYVTNLVDGSSIRLTNTPDQYEQVPTWSPDGQQIAFWWDRGDFFDNNLNVIDVNGENRREISENVWLLRSPTWSQDSRRLAFFAPTDDYMHIFIADVSTGSVQMVSSSYPRNMAGRIEWLTEHTLRIGWSPIDSEAGLQYFNIVDIVTGEELQRQPIDRTIAAVSPDERWSATYEYGNLCILARDTGETQRCFFIEGWTAYGFLWLP